MQIANLKNTDTKNPSPTAPETTTAVPTGARRKPRRSRHEADEKDALRVVQHLAGRVRLVSLPEPEHRLVEDLVGEATAHARADVPVGRGDKPDRRLEGVGQCGGARG